MNANTHAKLLQSVKNNSYARSIQINQKIFVQAFFQSQNVQSNKDKCYICIDMFSLLRHYIQNNPQLQQEITQQSQQYYNISNKQKSNLIHNINSSQSEMQDFPIQSQPKYNLSRHVKIVSAIIVFFYTLYFIQIQQSSQQQKQKKRQLLLVFPDNQQYFTSKSISPISKLINNLINVNWNEEVTQSKSQFLQKEYYYWQWCMTLYDQIRVQRLLESYGVTSEDEQVSIRGIVRKIKAPWLNKLQFLSNPCGRQLAYYSKLGYICLSWNPECLNYVPLGTYIIGLNINQLSQLYQFKNSLHNDSQQNQQNNLQTQLAHSEVIFYQKFQHFTYHPEQFHTNQLITQTFITVLTNPYPYFNINRKTIRQIKIGCYDTAKWVLQKILNLYLLLQLHPIVHNDSIYQQCDYSVENEKGFVDQIKVIYERQLLDLNQDLFDEIVRRYTGKVLFINEQLEPYITSFIPDYLIKNQLQQFKNTKSYIKHTNQQSTAATTQYKYKVQIRKSNLQRISKNLYPKFNESQIQQIDYQNNVNNTNQYHSNIQRNNQNKIQPLGKNIKINNKHNNFNKINQIKKIKINKEVSSTSIDDDESDIDDDSSMNIII